ncbi:glycerophosphodiester phosphodiesterase family protein [Demequina oxidasica]|uniref:glycerophosphodiester phosphodiesterase family protein n=1 Tax=Demequina oxidasica TaxID=676199 RepID=UPI00078529D6|nr:glycerophosphodiester phosphodiesterase family protein [Demequina oxidasica]
MTTRHPYFDNNGLPIALAHRGFSLDGLENSMRAFQSAVDLGYGYLETDAHGTLDGVAVALHDATLDRTTDATGEVSNRRWDSVKVARIGGIEPVPALEDVLGTWPTVKVNIDVKGVSAIEPVAKVIEKTKSHDRVCIGSFSADRRRKTLKLLSRPVASPAAQREAIGWLIGSVLGADPEITLGEVDALQIPWRNGRVKFLRKRQVASAHEAGRQIHVWTINDRDEMVELLDLGVDGIVSDRADILKEVLVERGQWA